MDNFSNTSLNATSPLSGPGYVVFNVVMLLGVVLPVIAVNTALLVALVLESSIVKVVRLALGSILVSCLIVALALVMYHIAGIVLNLSPVDKPADLPCTITMFLVGFGAAARLVFMAMFAIVAYKIVKYGKATRNRLVIAVLVAVIVLWVIAFLGSSPLLSQSINRTTYRDSLACGVSPVNIYSYVSAGLYVLFFCVVTLTVTIVFLIITICFLKHNTIPDTKVEKAMVKFGFFLLLGNGINMLGLFIPAVYSVIAVPPKEGDPTANPERNYTPIVFLNTALIPTPILVLIYFEPIRKRLWHWLCCCMPMKMEDEHIQKSSSAGGSSNTHGAQMTPKHV